MAGQLLDTHVRLWIRAEQGLPQPRRSNLDDVLCFGARDKVLPDVCERLLGYLNWAAQNIHLRCDCTRTKFYIVYACCIQ